MRLFTNISRTLIIAIVATSALAIPTSNAVASDVGVRMGYYFDTEADALRGRDRAVHGRYDLVLLDVRMPQLDGLDLLAELRRQRPDVDVVIITGYSSIDSAVKAVKLGAFDYLPKPFTPEELRARVDAALAARAARTAEPRTPPSHGRRLIGARVCDRWRVLSRDRDHVRRAGEHAIAHDQRGYVRAGPIDHERRRHRRCVAE